MTLPPAFRHRGARAAHGSYLLDELRRLAICSLQMITLKGPAVRKWQGKYSIQVLAGLQPPEALSVRVERQNPLRLRHTVPSEENGKDQRLMMVTGRMRLRQWRTWRTRRRIGGFRGQNEGDEGDEGMRWKAVAY